jgi:hypothetical protein
MSTHRPYDAVVEQEFLPLRARILEIAAGFDRMDRASKPATADPRREKLSRALQLLLTDSPERAAQVQMLFSREYDPHWKTAFELESQKQ